MTDRKRKISDESNEVSVGVKKEKVKEVEEAEAEVEAEADAETGSGADPNVDVSDANREIQKIIEETPSNTPETSILAMLGQGTVYNEATFKQKIRQALARGGSVNNALIEASKHVQFHLIQPLVDLGADVNYGDEIGMTSLHIAAANLNIQGVRILLNLGANKRAKANTGATPKMQTPVQIAREWKRLMVKNIGTSNPEVELIIQLLK